MARIKHEDRARTAEWKNIHDKSACIGENNDCGVKAIALTAGISYEDAHQRLEAKGRKFGSYSEGQWMCEILNELGFEVKRWGRHDTNAIINLYPGQHKNLQSVTTHHPIRFKDAWAFAKGRTFIAWVRNGAHVAAIVNGEVHDWSKGRPLRINWMWEIVRKN